ncbi:MAG: hypothetical protein M0R33_15155 [Methylomonas sp.]|jgi:adenosine deaminase|uniref:hypothetical protein n=1 Tax=Methylomonas sp. TaxID=418 RepID=UPI0025D7FB7C|nr:hypothetical protein [Methylomonas sp.]MCK9607779.1 hypothetical protein [Methylomonas sp.]
MTTNILLCTLGVSLAVISDAYAFLAPERLQLYQSHPEQEKLLALKAKYRLVGLDLVGDEQTTQPEVMASLFQPDFAECQPIIILAGEDEKVDSIWPAAYHVHAVRIGQGLSLNENDNLAQRFRDRSICLELCPSSNREVVGFYDPRFPHTQQYPGYPLLALWQKGLPLTVCTDNPDISCTTLADEYLTAALMTRNQLSQWDVLAMIKQGFVHRFLSGHHKEKLFKRIDADLYQLLAEAPCT